MLLIGMSEDLPYSYYQCLRWVVCLVSVALFFIQYNHRIPVSGDSVSVGFILYIVVYINLILAVPLLFVDNGVPLALFINFCGFLFATLFGDCNQKENRVSLSMGCLIIAVIFNPLIPVHTTEFFWKVIDFVIGLWFISYYASNDLYSRKLLITLLYKKTLKEAQEEFNSFRAVAELSLMEINYNLIDYIDDMCYLASLYARPGTFNAMMRGACANEQDISANSKEFLKSLERATEVSNSDSRFVEARVPEIYREKYKSKYTDLMYLLGHIHERGYHLGCNVYDLPSSCSYLSKIFRGGGHYLWSWEYWSNYGFQVGRIDKNPAKAHEWYKKAAELGHLQSMLRLAAMHTHGEGTIKDLKQAKYWINKAESSSQKAKDVIPTTQSSSNSTPLGESNPEVLSQNFTQYLSPPTKGLLNSSKTNLVSCDGEKAVFQMPEKFKFLKAKLEAKSEEIIEALKVSGSPNLKYITIELIPNSATTLEAKVVKPEGD